MKEYILYNNLFDIYSNLLTKNEQATFKDYYQENLSLKEIAEYNKISRSAVQKTIKNVLEKLNSYEKNLRIYQKKCKLRKLLTIEDIDSLKKNLERIIEE